MPQNILHADAVAGVFPDEAQWRLQACIVALI
jgi:hypothetical protein